MNVTITEDPRLADIEVAVSCPRIDERVQRIVAGLNAFERKLTGERDGATYRLDIDGICYVETVDGRTFLYTEDAVYRTPLRLYELEDKLAGTEFVRASKQLLANFDHVVAIRPAIATAAAAGQRRIGDGFAPVRARHQAQAGAVSRSAPLPHRNPSATQFSMQRSTS